MMKNISILGSTGSIGRQSLDVIEKLEGIKVVALTAGTSVDLMAPPVQARAPSQRSWLLRSLTCPPAFPGASRV